MAVSPSDFISKITLESSGGVALTYFKVAQVAVRMSDTHLSIRIPAAEMTILEQYCKKYKRTKTDVVREFIRSLNPKI